MAISLTFFLNACVNFALGLAVAAVLGPSEYGRFAVAFATALTLGTIVFDWLRLSTTRFYGDKSRNGSPDLRGSLNAMYLGGAVILVVAGLVIWAVGIDVGVSIDLLAAIIAVSVANAQFDFSAALARARFMNTTYAILVVVKNVTALATMVTAGLYFHSAFAVLMANALSVVAAFVSVSSVLRDDNAKLIHARRARLSEFARYGVPLVAANVFYMMIVLINRWVAAKAFGYAGAGHLSLSTDMSTRLLMAVGAGFDAYLFQLVVRSDFEQGRDAAERLVAKNALIVMAVLIPLAAGYAVTLPAFTMVLIPEAYRATFGSLSLILLPGILAFCAIQYAFAGVFTLAHRTGPYAIAAAAALVCDVVLLLEVSHITDMSLARIHSISLAVGCACAAVMAMQTQKARPAILDMLAVGFATGLMVVAVWPTRSIASPWLSLGLGTMIGGIVYCSCIVVFNVLGCRRPVLEQLKLIAPRMDAAFRSSAF